MTMFVPVFYYEFNPRSFPLCFQLEDFRKTILENTAGDNGVPMDISDDFRPAQCLFRRRIYASHPSLRYSIQYNIDFNDLNSSENIVGKLAVLLLSFTMIILL